MCSIRLYIMLSSQLCSSFRCDLYFQEVDFLFTMFGLTMERGLIMDYSQVLWYNEDSVIMYRKPDPEETNMGIFVKVSIYTNTDNHDHVNVAHKVLKCRVHCFRMSSLSVRSVPVLFQIGAVVH